MNQDGRYQTFAEFWPFYVREHANATNRRMHVVGTGVVIALAASAIVTGRWWLQVPPLECESTWYVNRKGRTSSPGVVTLVAHRPDDGEHAIFEETEMLAA